MPVVLQALVGQLCWNACQCADSSNSNEWHIGVLEESLGRNLLWSPNARFPFYIKLAEVDDLVLTGHPHSLVLEVNE